MATKCKKGYKKVGRSCVTKKSYKLFGRWSDDFLILKLALIGAITSVGGWAIFQSIIKILKLEQLNNWFMLGFGFLIILLVYKFGLSKQK